jgi:hypothetical protein
MGVEGEAQMVRLLGITLSNLDTETDELSFRQMELDLKLASLPNERRKELIGVDF